MASVSYEKIENIRGRTASVRNFLLESGDMIRLQSGGVGVMARYNTHSIVEVTYLDERSGQDIQGRGISWSEGSDGRPIPEGYISFSESHPEPVDIKVMLGVD